AKAAALRLGAGLDAVRVVPRARLVVREREHQVARRDARQQLLLLRVAAAEQDRVAGEQHGREKGLGREHLAELLEHHGELGVAEPETAVLLREQDAGPAELGHRAPGLEREPERIAGVTQRAHPRHRQVLREVRRAALQKLLLFRQDKIAHAALPPGADSAATTSSQVVTVASMRTVCSSTCRAYSSGVPVTPSCGITTW